MKSKKVQLIAPLLSDLQASPKGNLLKMSTEEIELLLERATCRQYIPNFANN